MTESIPHFHPLGRLLHRRPLQSLVYARARFRRDLLHLHLYGGLQALVLLLLVLRSLVSVCSNKNPILNHNYQLIEGHRVGILFAPMGPAAILLLVLPVFLLLPALLLLLGHPVGDLVWPAVAGTGPSDKPTADKDCFVYYLTRS